MSEHESREALAEKLEHIANAASTFADKFELLPATQVYGTVTSAEIQGTCYAAANVLRAVVAPVVAGDRERVLEEAARAVCWRCEQDGPAVHREGSGWRHGTEWCVAGQIWYMLAARTPEEEPRD